MDAEQEVAEAHAMLDRLGAVERRGIASIRERLGWLLNEYRQGKLLPTMKQVASARFGPKRTVTPKKPC